MQSINKNVINGIMVLLWALVISMVLPIVSIHAFKAPVTNKVIKIETDLDSARDMSYVQYGMVGLYFERPPLINTIPYRGDSNSMVFFFPQATISKEMHTSLMAAFDKQKYKTFSLYLEKVKTPVKGIRFVVTYDPCCVMVDKKNVCSSCLEPGVMVSFYNKTVLHKIQNKTKAILNISYINTPRLWHYWRT